MHIVIGSTNKAKVKAIEQVFSDCHVISLQAPSNVSRQPFTDEETRRGAINRAIFSQQAVNNKKDTVGIGLEGGVMELGNQLYLCNWGALALPNGQIIDASGVRILLPNYVTSQLKADQELGEIMAQLTKDRNVSQQSGAVGVLTNNLLTREEMYIHIAKLLRGQYEFQQ